MYLNAENVTVDDDEGRFTLVIDSTEEDTITVNIHGIDLNAFYDQVKARLGSYLNERDQARRTAPAAFRCDPDESGGYALDDPKSEGYHDRVVSLYDDRDEFSMKV